MAAECAVNIAGPVLVYRAAHQDWGDARALLAASAQPLPWAVGAFVRHRRLDAMSILVLSGIALSLLAFAGGGSARILALREKLATLLVALAFLGSAAIDKPLIEPLARAILARRSATALAAFEAKRAGAAVHHTMIVMTLAWGLGLLADAAVSVVLILTLPIADDVVVAPIVGYGTMGALALWTVRYRGLRRRTAGTGAAGSAGAG